jgi:hypothetical protein
MDNNLTSDYKIILIDSSNVFYNNGNNNFDFHINFLDPLRDVYKIKILYDAVSFNTNKLISNTSNLDIIYVNLNGLDRIRTSIIDPITKDINELYYFDSIMIDKNKIKINQDVNDTTMFNDFNENEGDYYLKPIASQFNRINIELRNKNNDLITKDYIDRFVMKICIYYNIKKISQF